MFERQRTPRRFQEKMDYQRQNRTQLEVPSNHPDR